MAKSDRSKEEWAEIVERWAKSETSVDEFAKTIGEKPKRLEAYIYYFRTYGRAYMRLKTPPHSAYDVEHSPLTDKFYVTPGLSQETYQRLVAKANGVPVSAYLEYLANQDAAREHCVTISLSRADFELLAEVSAEEKYTPEEYARGALLTGFNAPLEMYKCDGDADEPAQGPKTRQPFWAGKKDN